MMFRFSCLVLMAFLFPQCAILRDCHEFGSESLDDLSLVISDSVFIAEVPILFYCDSIELESNGFKKIRAHQIIAKDSAFSIWYDYKGNLVNNLSTSGKCLFSSVSLENTDIAIRFTKYELEYGFPLNIFAKNERRAYCKRIYNEQRDSYSLFFVGDKYKEFYELIFINKRLKEIEIHWNQKA